MLGVRLTIAHAKHRRRAVMRATRSPCHTGEPEVTRNRLPDRPHVERQLCRRTEKVEDQPVKLGEAWIANGTGTVPRGGGGQDGTRNSYVVEASVGSPGW